MNESEREKSTKTAAELRNTKEQIFIPIKCKINRVLSKKPVLQKTIPTLGDKFSSDQLTYGNVNVNF